MDLSWTFISDSSFKHFPAASKLTWGSQGALTQRLSHYLHQPVGLSHKCRVVKSIMMTVNQFVADRKGLNKKKVLHSLTHFKHADWVTLSLHHRWDLVTGAASSTNQSYGKLPLLLQKVNPCKSVQQIVQVPLQWLINCIVLVILQQVAL